MHEFISRLLGDRGGLFVMDATGVNRAHILRNSLGDLLIKEQEADEYRMLRPDGSLSGPINTSDPNCLEKARG